MIGSSEVCITKIHILCVLCLCYLELESFPANPPTESCMHRTNVCSKCMEDSVAWDLGNKGGTLADCPQCGEALGEQSILHWARDKARDRYERRQLEKTLEQDPLFIWCAHGCGSGVIHASGEKQAAVVCDNCRRKTCYRHRMPFHEGLTCGEYDDIQEDGYTIVEAEDEQERKDVEECQDADEGEDHIGTHIGDRRLTTKTCLPRIFNRMDLR